MSRSTVLALVFAALVSVIALVPTLGDAIGRSSQSSPAAILGTGFTFQGRLVQNGVPVSDQCDMEFALFADPAGTQQLGSTESTGSPVNVVNGLFSVLVNASGAFGPEAFDGNERFLKVSTRCPAGSGTFVALPLTALTPAPYAFFAMDSANLGGFPAADYARYARTIIVSPVGNQFDNGAVLLAAVAGITGADSDNRYLVIIEPGQYNIAAALQIPEWVDLRGSGMGKTTIQRNDAPAVIGANGVNISDLTIRAMGDGEPALESFGALSGFFNLGMGGMLTNVDIQGGSMTIVNTARLENVNIEVFCQFASACIGIDATTSFEAYSVTVQVSGPSATTGAGIVTTGALRLSDSEVFVSGGNGTTVTGVSSDFGLRVTDTRVIIGQSGSAVGMQSGFNSAVRNVDIQVAAAGTARGVVLSGDNVRIEGSRVVAAGSNGTQTLIPVDSTAPNLLITGSTLSMFLGGASSAGIRASALGDVLVSNSTLLLENRRFAEAAPGSDVYILNSVLQGAGTVGDVTCGNSTSATGDELDAACTP